MLEVAGKKSVSLLLYKLTQSIVWHVVTHDMSMALDFVQCCRAVKLSTMDVFSPGRNRLCAGRTQMTHATRNMT